jgi:hypothetical protein
MGLPSVNVTTPLASGAEIVKSLPLQASQNPVPAPLQQLKGSLKPWQSALLPPSARVQFPVPKPVQQAKGAPLPVQWKLLPLSEKTLSGFAQGKVTLPH